MSDSSDQDIKRPLSLGRPGSRLELRKQIETGQVRQSFPHGRSKTVTVEVRKKRALAPGQVEPQATPALAEPSKPSAAAAQPARRPMVLPRGLTAEERAGRVRALQGAIRADEDARKQAVIEATRAEEEALRAEEEGRRRAEEEAKRRTEDEGKRKAEEETKRKAEEDSRRQVAERAGRAAADKVAALTAAGKVKGVEEEVEDDGRAKRGPHPVVKKAPTPARRDEPRRRTGKLTITKVLNEDEGERVRSLASVRRAREREKQRLLQLAQEPMKIVNEEKT